jgi:hypothetical protein
MPWGNLTSAFASVGLLATNIQADSAEEAQLLEVRKIWDRAPHNAFTDLVRFQGQWYTAFREAPGHAVPPVGQEGGFIRVLRSEDGRQWNSAVLLEGEEGQDLRDPHLSVTPDDRLMVNGAAAPHEPPTNRRQSFVWFSKDGEQFSDAHPAADPDMWLWSVTWHRGICYGIGYSTVGRKFARLYKSDDGKTFETLVDDLGIGEYPNESALVFTEDDTGYCLLRRGGTGMIGTARPPYTEWHWKDLGVRIGGPELIRLPHGRFVAAVRLYDGRVRTSLCWIDPEQGTLTEFLKLPSGGDTSYPGMAWREGLLWISYYASHEGKTSIYLAKVKFHVED